LTCNPEYADCNAKPGYSDGCEKKIDEKHIWIKSFGGSGYDTGRLVAIDSSNNIYLAGEFESASIEFGSNNQKKLGEQDIFLVKFDSDGHYLWSKRFGGNDNDQGYSVSVDSSGNVYGTEFFVGDDTDFGLCPLPNLGGGDIYLIKYKP
jgi:small nuclear ribonucleoprotein (snRNP)-like protein